MSQSHANIARSQIMADNEFRALLDELGHLRHAHYEQQQQQQPQRGGEGVTRRQYELQPAFLSRFLRCTKGDVNKAARLIDSYWRVRDANGLPGIKSSTTDAQGKSTGTSHQNTYKNTITNNLTH